MSTENGKPKNVKLGALWAKTGPQGEQYFSGVLEKADGSKVNIVVFANGFKEEDKHPDYVIYLSRPMTPAPRASDPPKSHVGAAPKCKTKPSPEPTTKDDSDIPF